MSQLATELNASEVRTDVMVFNMDQKWKPILKEVVQTDDFTVFKIPAIANPFNFLPERVNPLLMLFRVHAIPKLGFTKYFKNYDIVHFCDEEDLSFPFFSLFSKKLKIMHLLTPIAFEAIRRNFFQREIFKRVANGYIPDSYEIQFLLQIGIIKSRIIAMESIGTKTCTFKPDESKRLDSLVLFVGRLQRLKGVHVLLHSLQLLKIPVHLAIIGPFDQRDPQYEDEIRKTVDLINSHGVHRVELLGRMNEEDLVPWYQKATLLVTPHLDGTSGLTNREALACATPVIATGTHLIKNGKNGLVVPPNDASKLARAISKLLEDKELRKKFGSEGRRIIAENYSWEKVVKDLIKVYERMLKNRQNAWS